MNTAPSLPSSSPASVQAFTQAPFRACGQTYGRRAFFLAALCLALLPVLALSGCGNMPVNVSMNGEMATPYHIHYNEMVYRNKPILFVQPTGTPNEPITGLFVPLRLTQNMNHSRSISRNVSRQMWQVWLGQQAFAALEYDDSFEPYRVSEALALARKRGAKLLVGGYITHLLDGGTVADSEVSVTMELYDVATGTMLWSMGQGARIEKKQASDYYLFAVQSRMPSDPMGLLTRTVAQDMGMEVYYWVYPHARKKGGLPAGKAF